MMQKLPCVFQYSSKEGHNVLAYVMSTKDRHRTPRIKVGHCLNHLQFAPLHSH